MMSSPRARPRGVTSLRRPDCQPQSSWISWCALLHNSTTQVNHYNHSCSATAVLGTFDTPHLEQSTGKKIQSAPSDTWPHLAYPWKTSPEVS